MSRTAYQRAISLMATVAWMVLIFWLSSIPDLRSGFQPLWDLFLRKIAHAIEYGVLACLAYMTLRSFGHRSSPALLSSFLFAAFYAATDEVHQSFVIGRHAALTDWAIDSAGAVIALFIIRFTRHRKSMRP